MNFCAGRARFGGIRNGVFVDARIFVMKLWCERALRGESESETWADWIVKRGQEIWQDESE